MMELRYILCWLLHHIFSWLPQDIQSKDDHIHYKEIQVTEGFLSEKVSIH